MKRPPITLGLAAALLYVFLYAPIVVVIVYSFNAARFGAGWTGFTTQWYSELLQNKAALAAAEKYLPEGHQSLGTVLNVRHIAATPVGMRVTATAEVVRVEGRTVYFRLEAHDEVDLIGDGTHERVVVNVAKFDLRVQAKTSRIKS